MGAGAPFPDLYDWTWGELVTYIEAKNEARTRELREEAGMLFRHALLTVKIFAAKKGTKFNIMEEFDFLWSDEERNSAAIENFKQQMLAMCKKEEHAEEE